MGPWEKDGFMRNEVAVSAEQVRQYERDGAVLLKNVLDERVMAVIEQGVEEVYEARGSRATTVGGMGGGQTLVRDYATSASAALRQLTDDGTIARFAAALMQTSSAQLILDQVFYKPAGPIVATPWHQDTPFLRVRGEQLVRLWIPCDRSPRELTVQVVRGSHRWNVVYNTAGTTADHEAIQAGREGASMKVGDSWLPPAPDVARYRESFDILSWDVEPGDILAFQGNMLHGADGHPGHDRPRRALAVLLGGPDLRFHAPEGKAFPSPGRVRGLRSDDRIPDGAPIGAYPDAFPICWDERTGVQ
jgi:ectoine hydroxylase-related dioxygenase (phytanoyl-CoA dioxygenase family)